MRRKEVVICITFITFSASSVRITIIWLELVGFRWSFCRWLNPNEAEKAARLPAHSRSAWCSLGEKQSAIPACSRLGKGPAPGSSKSRTNIQPNVEQLISKNLKQNCVHQQVPMKLAAALCCYVTPQQIGKNSPTSHDPWARRPPITLRSQLKAVDFIWYKR